MPWNSSKGEEEFCVLKTLNTIDQSHRDRLNGRAELFRELRHKIVHALGVDKEADV